MDFDQFIREILRYDMEHTEIDTNQKKNVWNRIVEGLSQDSFGKPDSMKDP